MSENGQEKRETLADIVADMRKAGALMPAAYMRDLLNYADRIEAAWKREREAVEANALAVGGIVEAARHKPGSAEEMREALVSVRALIDDEPDGTPMIDAMKATIDAALSAPARQCDVGTPDEQNRRFDNFCRGEDCKTCPCNVMPRCHMVWAQMPYEALEGGAE